MNSNHDSEPKYLYINNWSSHQHKQTTAWVKLYRSILDDADYILATPNQRHSLMASIVMANQDGRLPNSVTFLTHKSGCNPFEVDYLLDINWLTVNKETIIDAPVSSLLSPLNTKEETEAFNRFWTAYPKKSGRKDSIKAWHQVNGDNHIEPILAALKKLSGRWSELKERRESHFIPHPATWLRGERWNDEVEGGPKTDLEMFDYLNRGAL